MSALTYNYTREIAKLPWQRLEQKFSTNKQVETHNCKRNLSPMVLKYDQMVYL